VFDSVRIKSRSAAARGGVAGVSAEKTRDLVRKVLVHGGGVA